MTKWLRASTAAVLLAFLFVPPFISAEESSENDSSSNSDSQIEELRRQQEEYEREIERLQGEARTLKNEIASMDNQIYLTTSSIEEAEVNLRAKQRELDGLVEDIGTLEERLERLEGSIGHQEVVYQARLAEFYKSDRVSTWELIFGSPSISDIFVRIKYLKVLEAADRRLMAQMETTRGSYQLQKELLENKKTEVEEVKAAIEKEKANLEARKRSLASQKQAKNKLLEETQNDEAKYQKLLRESKAQIAAIQSLVASRGGASLLADQTACDDWGCYYNQRDSAWGTYNLGGSSESVAEYGCLVSSVAMLATHYGFRNWTPATIAIETSPFFSDTAYLWKEFEIDGVAVSRVSLSASKLDSALADGPVIAGVFGGFGYPAHFIVIKSKDGSDYVIHDPWYEGAHDVKLSEHYSVGDISRIDRVSIR